MKQLTLQEIQQSELKILAAFDSFCNEHGLTYSLVGGTLLGAVRHKGFIPWDDDIDVAMPRPDYEKFLTLTAERGYKLSDHLEVLSDRGEMAQLPFIKVVDKTVTVPPEVEAKTENLWIDVFPYDGCPIDNKKASKLLKKAKHYRHIIVYNHFKSSHFKGAKKPLYMAYSMYAKTFGLKKAIDKLNELAQSYPYENAECIACVVWGLYGMGEIISGDSFKNMIDLDFEGHKFSAIANYDEYLTGIYGDYMTPPPEGKRGSHHIVAYKNTESINEVNNE